MLDGAGELLPPAQDELDLLDVFNAPPAEVRLACQARLRPGATRLYIKAFHDERSALAAWRLAASRGARPRCLRISATT